MKVRVLLVALVACVSSVVFSQAKKNIEYSGFFDSYYWRGPLSITGGVGLAGYSGDLCSTLDCISPSPYFSLGLGYKTWPRVYFGAEIDYFTLNAKDKSETRGFEFSSRNIELAGYVNFYLREDIVQRHQDLIKKRKIVKPYVYLGLSGMRYNVTDNVGETTFPKHTILVPVGAGVNFHITHRINVKLEGIYKIAFTDYLDGVSQQANPDRNDAFGIIRAKLVYSPFARRMKPKTIKVDAEQRALWNERNKAGSGDNGDALDTSDSSTGSGEETKQEETVESENWDDTDTTDDTTETTEELENTEDNSTETEENTGDSSGDDWGKDSGDDWGSDGW